RFAVQRTDPTCSWTVATAIGRLAAQCDLGLTRFRVIEQRPFRTWIAFDRLERMDCRHAMLGVAGSLWSQDDSRRRALRAICSRSTSVSTKAYHMTSRK